MAEAGWAVTRDVHAGERRAGKTELRTLKPSSRRLRGNTAADGLLY